MPLYNEYSGIAALTITEALMLAIDDHELLPEQEIVNVLRDAADTQTKAISEGGDSVMHQGVAELINHIIANGNSVRRPRI